MTNTKLNEPEEGTPQEHVLIGGLNRPADREGITTDDNFPKPNSTRESPTQTGAKREEKSHD